MYLLGVIAVIHCPLGRGASVKEQAISSYICSGKRCLTPCSCRQGGYNPAQPPDGSKYQ